MKTTIQRITTKPGQRILVTSDIHGHLYHLKSVLEKAKFSPDDLLVIVGDTVQKGPHNLATLRYIMRLYEQGNVFVSAGNVDLGWARGFFSETNENFYGSLAAIRGWKRPTNLIDDMCEQMGIRIDSPESLGKYRAAIAEEFKPELDFLLSRPTVIDADRYVFVHGGLPSGRLETDAELDEFKLLKIDYYFRSAPICERWTLVGHFPVTLYGDKLEQANPLIDRERKVISLDGGIGLKHDGQLNLLEIPGDGSDEFANQSEDLYPIVTALDDQEQSREHFYIRWGDNEVRLLEDYGETALVEHIRTGHRMQVPSGHLLKHLKGENTFIDDAIDYRPEIRAGDKLSLTGETSKSESGDGYFIKKDGVSGRYFGRIRR